MIRHSRGSFEEQGDVPLTVVLANEKTAQTLLTEHLVLIRSAHGLGTITSSTKRLKPNLMSCYNNNLGPALSDEEDDLLLTPRAADYSGDDDDSSHSSYLIISASDSDDNEITVQQLPALLDGLSDGSESDVLPPYDLPDLVRDLPSNYLPAPDRTGLYDEVLVRAGNLSSEGSISQPRRYGERALEREVVAQSTNLPTIDEPGYIATIAARLLQGFHPSHLRAPTDPEHSYTTVHYRKLKMLALSGSYVDHGKRRSARLETMRRKPTTSRGLAASGRRWYDRPRAEPTDSSEDSS